MTHQVIAPADDICGGRVVAIHEGGFAEVVIPFCELAILWRKETLDCHLCV